MTPQERRRRKHQLAELDARLCNGWAVIDAEADSRTRRRDEDFWLQLLTQYERLADELRPPSW